jgi:hypothetical protein
MDVSIWWVAIAGVLGTWTGFVLCALMTIGRDAPPDGACDNGFIDPKAAPEVTEVTVQPLR